jgi:hypothetical protein
VIFSGSMAVSVEMQHTGDSGLQAEIRAIIEHLLADRLGDWRVSIVGSQANDRWEMKIVGPNGFERSYTLEGSAGEHQPEVIQVIFSKMLLRKKSLMDGRNFALQYATRLRGAQPTCKSETTDSAHAVPFLPLFLPLAARSGA